MIKKVFYKKKEQNRGEERKRSLHVPREPSSWLANCKKKESIVKSRMATLISIKLEGRGSKFERAPRNWLIDFPSRVEKLYANFLGVAASYSSFIFFLRLDMHIIIIIKNIARSNKLNTFAALKLQSLSPQRSPWFWGSTVVVKQKKEVCECYSFISV